MSSGGHPPPLARTDIQCARVLILAHHFRLPPDKHGLDFADAPMVLESPYRLDVESVRSGEPRMQSFAYVFEVLAVLTVVHLARDDALRIVSFRPASEEERSAYHDWLEEDFNGDQ